MSASGPSEEDQQKEKQKEKAKAQKIRDAQWQTQRVLLRQKHLQAVKAKMNFDSTTVQGQALPTSMPEDVVIVTQDEAWNIQEVQGCDRRVAEMDRYVARVVQYLTYSIAGQESGEMSVEQMDFQQPSWSACTRTTLTFWVGLIKTLSSIPSSCWRCARPF